MLLYRGYYIEERYRDVATQGKQGLPVIYIMLEFIQELTVAETHFRNGL